MSDQNQFVSVVDDEADIAYLFRDALLTIEGVDVFAFTDPVFKAIPVTYIVQSIVQLAIN
jgi:hypothetical protein